MNWNFIRLAPLALFLLVLPLVQAQEPGVEIQAWQYTFPDGDACVQFNWLVTGYRDHTLQIVLRGMDTSGDFLLNGVNGDFADSAGLLTGRVDAVMPFDETAWTDTLICLPAGQFPAGEYDWYPVLTIRDVTGGDVLLVTRLEGSIHFGANAEANEGSSGKVPAPQFTPEVGPR